MAIAASSVALELGRSLGSRGFAAAGVALAYYGPTSSIPNPANRGPIYRYYFAPEYALYSSRARPSAVSFLFRYRVSKDANLWASGRLERLSSAESPPLSTFVPAGSRTAGTFSAGITVLAP